MQTKKHTSWKKSRKLGDISGGRKAAKITDNIFSMEHNLSAPKNGEETPIFIVDNPSRDFYFPVKVEDLKSMLKQLPHEYTQNLTHIWLQKIRKTDYLIGDSFQGCFICGRGVNLIILHPFPCDNKMRLGKHKPTRKILNFYKEYSPSLHHDNNGWYLQWTRENIKKYYCETLLLHEVGHAVESVHKRYWSKARENKKENFADSFAFVWANNLRGKTF